MYLSLIHNIHKLALSLEGAVSFIDTVTFWGISKLIIPKSFDVILSIKLATFSIGR